MSDIGILGEQASAPPRARRKKHVSNTPSLPLGTGQEVTGAGSAAPETVPSMPASTPLPTTESAIPASPLRGWMDEQNDNGFRSHGGSVEPSQLSPDTIVQAPSAGLSPWRQSYDQDVSSNISAGGSDAAMQTPSGYHPQPVAKPARATRQISRPMGNHSRQHADSGDIGIAGKLGSSRDEELRAAEARSKPKPTFTPGGAISTHQQPGGKPEGEPFAVPVDDNPGVLQTLFGNNQGKKSRIIGGGHKLTDAERQAALGHTEKVNLSQHDILTAYDARNPTTYADVDEKDMSPKARREHQLAMQRTRQGKDSKVAGDPLYDTLTAADARERINNNSVLAPAVADFAVNDVAPLAAMSLFPEATPIEGAGAGARILSHLIKGGITLPAVGMGKRYLSGEDAKDPAGAVRRAGMEAFTGASAGAGGEVVAPGAGSLLQRVPAAVQRGIGSVAGALLPGAVDRGLHGQSPTAVTSDDMLNALTMLIPNVASSLKGSPAGSIANTPHDLAPGTPSRAVEPGTEPTAPLPPGARNERTDTAPIMAPGTAVKPSSLDEPTTAPIPTRARMLPRSQGLSTALDEPTEPIHGKRPGDTAPAVYDWPPAAATNDLSIPSWPPAPNTNRIDLPETEGLTTPPALANTEPLPQNLREAGINVPGLPGKQYDMYSMSRFLREAFPPTPKTQATPALPPSSRAAATQQMEQPIKDWPRSGPTVNMEQNIPDWPAAAPTQEIAQPPVAPTNPMNEPAPVSPTNPIVRKRSYPADTADAVAAAQHLYYGDNLRKRGFNFPPLPLNSPERAAVLGRAMPVVQGPAYEASPRPADVLRRADPTTRMEDPNAPGNTEHRTAPTSAQTDKLSTAQQAQRAGNPDMVTPDKVNINPLNRRDLAANTRELPTGSLPDQSQENTSTRTLPPPEPPPANTAGRVTARMPQSERARGAAPEEQIIARIEGMQPHEKAQLRKEMAEKGLDLFGLRKLISNREALSLEQRAQIPPSLLDFIDKTTRSSDSAETTLGKLEDFPGAQANYQDHLDYVKGNEPPEGPARSAFRKNAIYDGNAIPGSEMDAKRQASRQAAQANAPVLSPEDMAHNRDTIAQNIAAKFPSGAAFIKAVGRAALDPKTKQILQDTLGITQGQSKGSRAQLEAGVKDDGTAYGSLNALYNHGRRLLEKNPDYKPLSFKELAGQLKRGTNAQRTEGSTEPTPPAAKSGNNGGNPPTATRSPKANNANNAPPASSVSKPGAQPAADGTGQATAKDNPKIQYGATVTAKTPAGNEIKGRWGVVDADDLITSHDSRFAENPHYDQGLQNRDRSAPAAELQVNKIVREHAPSKLAGHESTAKGSPIIGPDLQVESGNGRTMAQKIIYETNPTKAGQYKAYMKEHAAEYGLKPEAFDGPKPVLVRINEGGSINRYQMANESNMETNSAPLPMPAADKARSDAQAITPDMVKSYAPDEAGGIYTAANRQDFIPRFLKTLGPNEAAKLMGADGNISADGIKRIRNAMFAKAYGGSAASNDFMQRTMEAPEGPMKTIVNMLHSKAGTVAALPEGFELGPDVIAAVRKMDDIGSKAEVDAWMKQNSMFDDLSPVQRSILETLNQNRRKPAEFGKIFDTYAQEVNRSMGGKQGSIFSGELGDKEAIWQNAVKKTQEQAAKDQGEQGGLFGDGPGDLSGKRPGEAGMAVVSVPGWVQKAINTFKTSSGYVKADMDSAIAHGKVPMPPNSQDVKARSIVANINLPKLGIAARVKHLTGLTAWMLQEGVVEKSPHSVMDVLGSVLTGQRTTVAPTLQDALSPISAALKAAGKSVQGIYSDKALPPEALKDFNDKKLPGKWNVIANAQARSLAAADAQMSMNTMARMLEEQVKVTAINKLYGGQKGFIPAVKRVNDPGGQIMGEAKRIGQVVADRINGSMTADEFAAKQDAAAAPFKKQIAEAKVEFRDAVDRFNNATNPRDMLQASRDRQAAIDKHQKAVAQMPRLTPPNRFMSADDAKMAGEIVTAARSAQEERNLRDSNKFASMVYKAGENLTKPFGPLGQVAQIWMQTKMPFLKIHSNNAYKLWQRTPPGAAVDLYKGISTGDQKLIGGALTRGAFGTGLLALGWSLGNSLMTPHTSYNPFNQAEDQPERILNRAAQRPEGALKTGDSFHKADWLGSAFWFMSMGAKIRYDVEKEKREKNDRTPASWSDFNTSATGDTIHDLLLQHPIVSSESNTIANLLQEGGFKREIADTISEAPNAIPGVGLARTVGQYTDNYQRDKEDAKRPDINNPVAKFMQGVGFGKDTAGAAGGIANAVTDNIKYDLPGTRQTLPKKATALGQYEEHPWYFGADPSHTQADNHNPVVKMLDSVHQGMSALPREPGETREQYDKRALLAGRNVQTGLSRLGSDSGYQTQTPHDKGELISKTVTASRKMDDRARFKEVNPHDTERSYRESERKKPRAERKKDKQRERLMAR